MRNNLFDIEVDALGTKILLPLHRHHVQLPIVLGQIKKSDDLYSENKHWEFEQGKSHHRLCIFVASDIH